MVTASVMEQPAGTEGPGAEGERGETALVPSVWAQNLGGLTSGLTPRFPSLSPSLSKAMGSVSFPF
jgi:hypothetical protein